MRVFGLVSVGKSKITRFLQTEVWRKELRMRPRRPRGLQALYAARKRASIPVSYETGT